MFSVPWNQAVFYRQGYIQFSSVAQSCPTLCDPMNRSTPYEIGYSNISPHLPISHNTLEGKGPEFCYIFALWEKKKKTSPVLPVRGWLVLNRRIAISQDWCEAAVSWTPLWTDICQVLSTLKFALRGTSQTRGASTCSEKEMRGLILLHSTLCFLPILQDC